MKCNPAGIELIRRFEGCRLQSYKDCVGVLTIGFGSTENVCEGMTITMEEALKRLMDHLVPLEVQIEHLVKTPLTDNQFSSIVSFCYNLGIGTFERSTMLKYLNAAQYQKAADEFERFCLAGGRVVQGLLTRRGAERELFLRG